MAGCGSQGKVRNCHHLLQQREKCPLREAIELEERVGSLSPSTLSKLPPCSRLPACTAALELGAASSPALASHPVSCEWPVSAHLPAPWAPG